MPPKARLQCKYKPSENVVARLIDGELLIVPINSGVGNLEDAVFTLNETGREIWSRLNGAHTLESIAKDLQASYEIAPDQLREDVIGLMQELLDRGMAVEAGE